MQATFGRRRRSAAANAERRSAKKDKRTKSIMRQQKDSKCDQKNNL
jgi:hypothetical protein